MNQDTFLRHFLGIVCVISLYALLLDLRNDTLLPRVGMGFAGLFAATTITFSKSQSSLIGYRTNALWYFPTVDQWLSGRSWYFDLGHHDRNSNYGWKI